MKLFNKKLSSQVTILIVTWLLSFISRAETVATPPSKNISAFTNWPVILLVLIGMIGLILAMAWFVKRFGGMNFSGNREMKVVTSIALGARERVALIDIKGQQFLLGVTTQKISHLHTFEEAVIPVDDAKKSPIQSEFAAKLQAVLNPSKTNKVFEPQSDISVEKSAKTSLDNTTQHRDGHAS